MIPKAPLDQLNYAIDNGHEKKPEAKKHDRMHVVINTEYETLMNETLETGLVNVNIKEKDI